MKLTLVTLILWVLALGTSAQMLSVTAEVDTVFGGPSDIDPGGQLDGYTSYLIYANFTNPTDVLSAIFSDTQYFNENAPMAIDAPCGCWNPDDEQLVIGSFVNSVVVGNPEFSLFEYDTFWTIGKMFIDEPGQTPNWVSNPLVDGANICSEAVTDGVAYVTGQTGNWPENAIAGDDLRILIGRVTTCGPASIIMNAQVFIADEGDEQLFVMSEGLALESGGYYEPEEECDGEFDACGICNGPGAIYECGCFDIADGTCDCDGTLIDECGVCGGAGIPDGACDCDGSVLDEIGVCGGDCISDVNNNGICDLEELENVASGGLCGQGTTWDDESQTCIVAYPADINLDGCVQLNDLLDLLSVYGDCGAEESVLQCGVPLEYQGYDYETVQIGEQCWFAENLRNEHYENGDAISANLSDSEWSTTSLGAVAVYGEDVGCTNFSPDIDACDPDQSLNEYGRLYNWYAVVDARGLCPSGWHVPSDDEWIVMTEFLGGDSLAGGQMKTDYGWSNGANGTNSSGFSGLPSGYRPNNVDYFAGAGTAGAFWSSSPWTDNLALCRWLFDYYEGVAIGYQYPENGFSVRCVRDAE